MFFLSLYSLIKRKFVSFLALVGTGITDAYTLRNIKFSSKTFVRAPSQLQLSCIILQESCLKVRSKTMGHFFDKNSPTQLCTSSKVL